MSEKKVIIASGRQFGKTTKHIEFLESELTRTKQRLERAVKELTEIKSSVEWYQTKGTEQEFHHFFHVELPHYLEEALAEIQADGSGE